MVKKWVLFFQRINKAIEDTHFEIGNETTARVTISVGVSTYPGCGETTAELIEIADKGLYYAKEHGRNQVKCIIEKVNE